MILNKEDYVARVTNASRLGLLIVNYELAIDFIQSAKQCSGVAYDTNIIKAVESVRVLIDSLDINYELSLTLMDIYLYVNKLLYKALYSKKPDTLDEAERLLSNLMLTWRELGETEDSGEPIMENAQKLYAGLTYKNGKLDEFVPEDTNRGYRV